MEPHRKSDYCNTCNKQKKYFVLELRRHITEYAKIVWDPHTMINCTKLATIRRLDSRFLFTKNSRAYFTTKLCEVAKFPILESKTIIVNIFIFYYS